MMTAADKHPIKRLLSNCQVRLWSWLSPVLGWLTILYVSATMLINYDTETTNISGAVFVAVAGLAGLAFMYAGALPDDDRDRVEVLYAGERFCQGAMIFLFASLLKYGTIVIPTQIATLPTWTKLPFLVVNKVGIDILVIFLQFILFMFFVNGLLVARMGYEILGRVVMLRTSRRQTADGYFPFDTRSANGSREKGKKPSQEE